MFSKCLLLGWFTSFGLLPNDKDSSTASWSWWISQWRCIPEGHWHLLPDHLSSWQCCPSQEMSICILAAHVSYQNVKKSFPFFPLCPFGHSPYIFFSLAKMLLCGMMFKLWGMLSIGLLLLLLCLLCWTIFLLSFTCVSLSTYFYLQLSKIQL